MTFRLRQIAVAVTDLEGALADAEAIFGASHPYEDSGVARYKLRNAVYRFGDTFLELLTPVAGDTTVGRLLARQEGDCGYMVILQTDRIEEARSRVAKAGIRVVDQLDRNGCGFTHLHPRDVGGTLLSIDYMSRWTQWEWGGPGWESHAAPACSIVAAEMHGPEPELMARRWSAVLGLPCSEHEGGWRIALDGGELLFLSDSERRGEGLRALAVLCAQPEAVLEQAAKRGRASPDGGIRLWGMTVRVLGPASKPPLHSAQTGE
ncbi:VOC family protein [Novosphingobium tardum]|uniref:VOC family protein n=1 Tax=Novosphingobium tardum TaxID=1538021 RepID=A0ABV8RL01_9SPHN